MATWRYKVSLLVLKIFHSFAVLTREIFFNTKINFISPCCHVISSIYSTKSAFFNCPFLNILLAKSRHGVMYNYYFFSHG